MLICLEHIKIVFICSKIALLILSITIIKVLQPRFSNALKISRTGINFLKVLYVVYKDHLNKTRKNAFLFLFDIYLLDVYFTFFFILKRYYSMSLDWNIFRTNHRKNWKLNGSLLVWSRGYEAIVIFKITLSSISRNLYMTHM